MAPQRARGPSCRAGYNKQTRSGDSVCPLGHTRNGRLNPCVRSKAESILARVGDARAQRDPQPALRRRASRRSSAAYDDYSYRLLR
jgi:hypothetical protein